MKIYKLLPLCSLLFLMACGDDSSSANNSDPENKSDPLEIFKTRKPKADAYTCKPSKGSEVDWTEKFDQQDWICSFKYDDDEGFVYVQTSPTGCETRFSMLPEMSVDTAVFYVNGKYESVKVTYDWGGNHHNDSFRFKYDGKVFEYNHSSYGWGYRSCQEMDCLIVYKADGKTVIKDGCGAYEDDLNKSRSLPVVCRFADIETGKFGDFTDKYELCLGDYRLQEPIDD